MNKLCQTTDKPLIMSEQAKKAVEKYMIRRYGKKNTYTKYFIVNRGGKVVEIDPMARAVDDYVYAAFIENGSVKIREA